MRVAMKSHLDVEIPYEADEIQEIELTISQSGPIIVKATEDVTIEDYLISVTLTPQETSLFDFGDEGQAFARVQIKFYLVDGSEAPSDVFLIPVKLILNRRVRSENES